MVRCHFLSALLVGASFWGAATTGEESLPVPPTKGNTPGVFPVRQKDDCFGQELEQGACPDLKPCEDCTPVDCDFGEWGEWKEHGDCSGLKVRKREITTQENECGKPCDGALTETAETKDLDPKCTPPEQVCSFGEWDDWTACTTPSEQKFRRRVFSYEAHEGKVTAADCDKETVETAPCSYAPGKVPVDCKFNMWGGWTDCSTSCNVGWQSRSRTSDPPVNGGKPCNGTLRESQMCNEDKPCEKVNCKFGQWSAWTGCNAESPYSKSRTRSIDIPSKNGGTECAGATEETECCDFMVPSDCKMSEWSDWGGCSPKGACGANGQSFRTRRVLSEPFNGGTCPDSSMQETRPCELPNCTVNEEDCKLNEWEEWGDCSTTCGQGEKLRKRDFKEATGQGAGCTGNLTEVAACGTESECDKADCEWNDWSAWSDCTVTCGNGSKTRSRNIKTSPRNGGKFCTAEIKREAAVCDAGDCKEDCVDGEWSAWNDWSSCTTSCGPGYTARHRQVAKHPNVCGTPATGPSEEYEPCNTGKAKACKVPEDCKLAEWTDWGDCSNSCYGHAFRSREIKAYARYGGEPCNNSLRDVTSCNPFPTEDAPKECVAKEKDECEFEDWSAWTECTNCGGGYQRRDRVISNRPCQMKAGENATLIETKMCPAKDCPKEECTDCVWSIWSEWSACSHCGDQKRRTRYVKSSANYCGKPCNETAAVELGKCDSPCEDFYYCQWTKWYEGPCTATCGPAVHSMERHLTLVKDVKELPVTEYLFKGFKDSKCSGVQKKWEDCGKPNCTNDCKAENCELTDWAEWGDLGGGCMGLCQRNRGIKSINNECGTPCNDTLTETKECPNKCNKTVDCEFCDWSEWTVCYSDYAQSTRVRSPMGCKDPECGGGLLRGAVCAGALKETQPCKTGSRDINCEFADWESWGKCTVTCGGGRQQRERYIKTAAEGIGAGCTGNMSEVQDCNMDKCSTIDQDCKINDWSDWQDKCDKENQRVRTRNVTQVSLGAGTPCNGSLVETIGCQPKVVDCKMTDWNEWAKCDKTCGGGQRKRERVPMVLPQNGGEPCEGSIQMIEACNTVPCDPNQDCEFEDWSEWSECTRECGGGQRNKTRKIAHEAAPAGAGCVGTMNEVEGCGQEPCTKDVDCVWGNWNDWSACSVTCGGGTYRRHRRIKTFPIGQGKKCANKTKEEIAPCKEERCEACKDGSWGQWGAWTTCTATCGTGVQWRHRDVKEMANECGEEPEGLATDLRTCNPRPCRNTWDVDCKLQDWGDWHGCSAECNGYRRRVRDIETNGAGNGDYCQAEVGCKPLGGKGNCTPASLEEFEGCHQDAAACEDKKVKDVDCAFTEWSEWDCPVTCGRGQAVSTRTIKTPPTGNGASCTGVMNKTGPCMASGGGPLKPCKKDEELVNCEYEDWSEWGDCTKCAGQKFRTRDIKSQAENGGEACAPNATRETVGCSKRECGKPHFCSWQDWQDWGTCDKTCGSGKRSRKRHLELTSKKVFETRMEMENLNLQQQLDSQKDAHIQEVVLSFSAGAACLMFVVFIVRLRQGSIGRPRRPSFDHGQGFE